MKSKVEQRLQQLTVEIDRLHSERQILQKQDEEIQVRMHQVVGAIYELQQLLTDLDYQPSEQSLQAEPQQQDQLTHPSEGVDQDSHQAQPIKIEMNNQQQS
jgi:hypothetical protein